MKELHTEEAVAEGAPGIEKALQALHVDQEVDEVGVSVPIPSSNGRCNTS